MKQSFYGPHSRSPFKTGVPGHPWIPIKNQCDGCAAGVETDARGFHRMGKKEAGYPDYMICQKELYLEEEE